MSDTTQPRKDDRDPIRIAEAETEFLNCQYVFVDAVGDTTRRPNRDPRATQLRPDQSPSPPATDQDKQT